MNHANKDHLSAERLQAFLEGEMPDRDFVRAEEHLSGCARCSAEMDTWRALFHDLGDLSRHRPHEGFIDRVMAEVDVPEARPLAARLRDRAAALLGAREHGHIATEALQDFLDGSLAARRAERLERHLGRCAPCAAEAESWLAVMRQLDALPSFAPSEHFAERVLSAVEVPERTPLAGRIRRGAEWLLGSAAPEHVPAGMLQDLLDGALPATATARVETHLADCGACAGELESWRLVAARLGSLERFEPGEGFVDRVMDGFDPVRAAHAATAPTTSRAPALAPAWSRLLAAARRLVPRTRRAWAALSGVAVTPAVTVGLVFWTLFSHPTLTLGSLASFAWWQVSDLMTAAVATVTAGAIQSAEIFGVYALLETIASAPAMVAGGVLLYTTICALALRVLYKNLIANRPSGGRYAHASTAS